ncbi:MtrAB system histidine kinase MtrB [Thermoactinospora rubra]|uniref:MtrAB system histidine kinase MtrB n=1 Tax=Thermoactinospora rubra TaxID=1088767 RepID=UPI000A119DF3
MTPAATARRRTFRQILGGVRRRARRAARRVRHLWRSSLQMRVVTSTLAISMTVVAVLGYFLFQEISDSVVDPRRASVISDARNDTATIRNILLSQEDQDDAPKPGQIHTPAIDQAIKAVSPVEDENRRYDLIILNPEHPEGSRIAGAVSEQSIPPQLRAAMDAFAEKTLVGEPTRKSIIAAVPYERGGTQISVVTGVVLEEGRQVYHFSPLTAEEDTLSAVRQVLVLVGLGLVLLLAAIASLVTRQVVVPVRLARQAAERLAAGQLDERLKVRGEDDLARLATSFNEMAANLALKIHQLEELSQVQRQFVSDVSHELRTPLTTVRMAADLIYDAREDFDPMVARSAELMQAQLERFESMLADLLEISRYDAGAATLDLEQTDIRDVVLRAVDDSVALAERHSTRFDLRLPNEPCMAEIDARRVERILRNLLFNAIEHGEGKDIVVTVGADRDAVAVAVRDHGVGLKPGEENMVFDRFWRADPSRARTIGGTGLGLAISREDATLHGGWLQAWGQPGEGSQFRLTLPRDSSVELKGSPLPLEPPEIQIRRTWRGHITPVLAPATSSPAAGPAPGPAPSDEGVVHAE